MGHSPKAINLSDLRLVALDAHPTVAPPNGISKIAVFQAPSGKRYLAYVGGFQFEPEDVGRVYDAAAQLGTAASRYGKFTGDWLKKPEWFTPAENQPELSSVAPHPSRVTVAHAVAVESRSDKVFVNYSDAVSTDEQTIHWSDARLHKVWVALFGYSEGEHIAGLEFGAKGVTVHRSNKPVILPR